MENIYENGPSEIGYGATSLALVMQEMAQGGGSVTHAIKHVMPNLLWHAYAGGWLVMYLVDEVHSFIDHKLDRDDTELSYLANSHGMSTPGGGVTPPAQHPAACLANILGNAPAQRMCYLAWHSTCD